MEEMGTTGGGGERRFFREDWGRIVKGGIWMGGEVLRSERGRSFAVGKEMRIGWEETGFYKKKRREKKESC